jgi:hypothetical protein
VLSIGNARNWLVSGKNCWREFLTRFNISTIVPHGAKVASSLEEAMPLETRVFVPA